VQLGRPVAALARPVPLPGGVADSFVKQASFSDAWNPGAEGVVRGQMTDSSVPRQMPVGPATSDQSTRMFVWEAAKPQVNVPPGVPVEEIPAPRSIAPGPMPMPGPMSVPGQMPVPGPVPVPGPIPGDTPPGVIVSEPHAGIPVYPTSESCGEEVLGGCCTDGACCSTGACCTDGACCSTGACCDGCCYPGHRFYASAEYLLWWTKGSPLPPLLTTTSGPVGPGSGALGDPNTQILYGNNTVNNGVRSGFRLMTGYWFDDERLLGVEVGGFWLQNATASFSTSSDGSAGSVPLFRPFFNPTNLLGGPGQNAEPIAVPGVTAGGFSSQLRSSLWGAEGNLRSNLLCNQNFFLDGLVGVRVLNLNESLTLSESPLVINTLPGGPLAGSLELIQDRFQTQNTFYGGQVGLVGEVRSGPWSLNMMGKLGLGVTQQTVDISGSTQFFSPGSPPQFFNQGFYAGLTNSGRFTRNVFSVVPEIGLNIGYQVTEHLRLFAGYNFLYWSNVVRPGSQINLMVNPTMIAGAGPGVGPAQPTFAFNSSSFWVQGVTFGIEFRF